MRDPSLLDAEIRAYLEAENAYTEAVLADTKPLQETLFQEMKARLKEDDRQVPQPHGPYEYFPRFVRRRAIRAALPYPARRLGR